MTALHDLLKDARNYLESIGYTQKPNESEVRKITKIRNTPRADIVAHGMEIWFDRKMAAQRKKKDEVKNAPPTLDVDISPKSEAATNLNNMASVISHIDTLSTGSILGSWQQNDLLIEFPAEEQKLKTTVAVEEQEIAIAVEPEPPMALSDGVQTIFQADPEPGVIGTVEDFVEPLIGRDKENTENNITFEIPLDQILLDQTPEEIVLEAKERWLNEKKNLRLAKKQEDADLKEFYNHKRTEFRKNIGTSW